MNYLQIVCFLNTGLKYSRSKLVFETRHDFISECSISIISRFQRVKRQNSPKSKIPCMVKITSQAAFFCRLTAFMTSEGKFTLP